MYCLILLWHGKDVMAAYVNIRSVTPNGKNKIERRVMTEIVTKYGIVNKFIFFWHATCTILCFEVFIVYK